MADLGHRRVLAALQAATNPWNISDDRQEGATVQLTPVLSTRPSRGLPQEIDKGVDPLVLGSDNPSGATM